MLEARGLHTYYGSSHVLQGVDFTVGKGEVVALMGRNGMGKTTLIRSLLGLVRPRAGDVRLEVYRSQPGAIRIARLVWYMFPKAVAFSRTSPCAKTSSWPRAPHWTPVRGFWSVCWPPFRAWVSVWTTVAAIFQVASSRC